MTATVRSRQELVYLDPEQAGSRGVRWLLAASVLVLLVISWYPFAPELPRPEVGGVEVLADGSLRFSNDEFASTPRPPTWLATAIESEQLELALRVRSTSPDQSGPARIVALSAGPRGTQDDVSAHNLMIGQDGSDLVVRVVRPGSDLRGLPELVAPRVFSDDGWHEVELVLSDDIALRVDGEVRALETGVSGWAAGWDEDHRLSLGNTLSGTRPWSGSIARARVLAGAEHVDLLASDELHIPAMGVRLPSRLTAAASRVGIGDLLIGVLHVLLGSVIGGAVVLSRPGRPLVDSLWVAPTLFAVASLGKVVVAGRHPSIATFLLQTGGGGLGSIAACTFVRSRGAGDDVRPSGLS